MCVHMCGTRVSGYSSEPQLGHFPASLRTGVLCLLRQAAGMTRPREQAPLLPQFPPYVKAGESDAAGRGPFIDRPLDQL